MHASAMSSTLRIIENTKKKDKRCKEDTNDRNHTQESYRWTLKQRYLKITKEIYGKNSETYINL